MVQGSDLVQRREGRTRIGLVSVQQVQVVGFDGRTEGYHPSDPSLWWSMQESVEQVVGLCPTTRNKKERISRMMDIGKESGEFYPVDRHVIFTGKGGYGGEVERACREGLIVGIPYPVVGLRVQSASSQVKLKDFDQWFNCVMFDDRLYTGMFTPAECEVLFHIVKDDMEGFRKKVHREKIKAAIYHLKMEKLIDNQYRLTAYAKRSFRMEV